MERIKHLVGERWELGAEIGTSPVGRTYRACDVSRGAPAFLTLLVLGDEVARVKEAVGRATGLCHPHVAAVLGCGRDGDRAWVAEAAVEADALDRVLASGPLPAAEALHVARQLADALAHVHAAGIVHGALVPERVHVIRGMPPHTTLSGFATAPLAGTILPACYTAPERAAGKPADERTDVFGLGLLLFEMIEGRPLVTGPVDARELLVPRFSTIAPTGVSGVVGRAVRHAPAQRQQSMAQMIAELDECLRRLGELAVTRAAPPTRRGQPRLRAGVVVDDAVGESDAPPVIEVRPVLTRPPSVGRAPLAVDADLVRRVLIPTGRAARRSRRVRRLAAVAGLLAIVALALESERWMAYLPLPATETAVAPPPETTIEGATEELVLPAPLGPVPVVTDDAVPEPEDAAGAPAPPPDDLAGR